MERDREDESADAAACGDDPEREAAVGRAVVLGHDSDAGEEDQTGADSGDDALGEHELPVLGAEAGHHETEGYQNGSSEEGIAHVAGVDERSGEDTDEEEQEGLH